MNYPKYQYRSEEQFLHYEFISEGPRGTIKKVIEYTPMSIENIYNLSFGDFDEHTKRINDLIITNNGDSLKVLATVASTIYAFTEKYPDAWILAIGSTAVRTRLYRMGITNNLSEIWKDFIVFGYNINEYWEEFITGVTYEAFLISKKENKFVL